jgi:tetratricopeptide (TPR) repeat protein
VSPAKPITLPVSTAARRAAVLLLPLLAAGCSHYQPFDSVGHLRSEYATRVGPAGAGIEVPFALNPEVKAAVDKQVRAVPNERRQIDDILEYIFQRLGLRYALFPTRSASETYLAREGNCLSFVNLFVGVARERGLNPFYVEVMDYQKWNRRAGMVISQGHIVAGMYVGGDLKTYDFLPYRAKGYKSFKPIDDLTASAHYYNNLGGEALLEGDYEKAGRFLPIATQIDPGFVRAWSNLGVYYARSGQPERALEALQKGLGIEPQSSTLLINLASLYQGQGRQEEAAKILSQVEELETANPYFFLYESDLALSRGEPQKALDYLARALRQDTENPDVHVGLAQVYLALGEVAKAKHHLSRALTLDATNVEARKLAALMGQGQPAGQ